MTTALVNCPVQPAPQPLAAALRACLGPFVLRPLAAAGALALALSTPLGAHADIYTVTNFNDSGPGSLRQAMNDANARVGADEIVFASTVSGTIALTSGPLVVADALTLTGPGASVLTLDGGGADLLHAEAYWEGNYGWLGGQNLTISGLTLANGENAIDGEERYINLDLRVKECIVTGHSGWAIIPNHWYHSSRVTIEDSVIADNGGGLAVRGGSGRVGGTHFTTIRNSRITGNRYSAVAVSEGTILVSDSTIANNGTGFSFGTGYGVVDARIIGSLISGNSGSGIEVNAGGVSIVNSTITANLRGVLVAPRYSDSIVEIQNSTITDNVVGGIYLSVGGFLESGVSIRNSIISGNGRSTQGGPHPDGQDLYGPAGETAVFNVNYSLIQAPGTVSIEEAVADSNVFYTDPLLGPLGDNGGPTDTQAPLPGSPVIDRGDPNFSPPPEFDQRGPGYPRVVGGRIDLGAVEIQVGADRSVWLQPLGDINGDGTPEIGVISRVDGHARATVKDAATGALMSEVAFSDAVRSLVGVETLPAVSPGHGPNLVLLGAAPTQAETRNALTGDLLGTVSFDLNPLSSPVDLAVLPDQGGNGVQELAALVTAASTLVASTQVEVRDAATGTLFNTLSFPAQFEPRQVVALPDLNGNGSAEVGVVLSDPAKADRLVINDTRTGAAVQTLWSGADLLQAAVVADRNGNGLPEVALLWRDPAAGDTHVWVVDAATNQRVASLAGFGEGYDPLKLAVVADLDGNGVDDYAVLGRKTATGQVAVSVQEGATGRWLNRFWYDKGCTPLDLASIADTNHNGAAELVMLGRCGADGQLQAVVTDARTGQVLNRLTF